MRRNWIKIALFSAVIAVFLVVGLALMPL